MKFNLFDLTGNETFCCSEGIGETEVVNGKTTELGKLLIYPRDKGANKNPYLQNPAYPVIDDFQTDGYNWDFSNSFFLYDILAGIIPAWQEKLWEFFQCQIAQLEDYQRYMLNIILVPDDYDAMKQEVLLRNCGFPRDQTFLLWRSVAICIGAEQELAEKGAKNGDQVAVVEVQANHLVYVSILTLRQDGSFLIPARSSFSKKSKYPYSGFPMKKTSSYRMRQSKVDFWKHTWMKEGQWYVSIDGEEWWKERFEGEEYFADLSSELKKLRDIPFWIVEGTDKGIIQGVPAGAGICRINDNRHEFALRGAGRFAVRKTYKKPTYFDECEPLYFIIQDESEEKIYPKALIEGREFRRGGEKIIGETNEDFFLQRDSDSITFLMHVGEIKDSTPLKELKQIFKTSLVQDQKLTLTPSMIPGQGIARVKVEGWPVLQEPVELDFLNMKDAIDDKMKPPVPKTIKHLQDTLPRSFPVDFPDVEASSEAYQKSADKVSLFLKSNRLEGNDWFAQTKWPDKHLGGIAAYRRVNVFGTAPEKEFPTCRSREFFDELFRRLALKYKLSRDEKEKVKIKRLIAWTYHCGRKHFDSIIQECMQKLRWKAVQNDTYSLVTQEFTIFSNMLTVTEQEEFISCFIAHSNYRLSQAAQTGQQVKEVDHWIRALMGILIYSNDLLRNVDSEECELCMDRLYQIWISYVHGGKAGAYIDKVICCMLFLLRRRKYDHSFLREKSSKLFDCILENQKEYNISDLANSFFEYLQNKGNIDIPLGNILSNGNDDDND